MNIVEFIRKKQAGKELNASEVAYFIEGVVSNAISDYQIAAFLMAIFFKGMSLDETYYLTRAMVDHSETLTHTTDRLYRVDKHSTGGVGDKVSIMLVPLLASCGLCIPMISGRGLGHTGGTLDKLESIPGLKTMLSKEQAERQLDNVGAVFLGQSECFVPADRKLYAIRDLTCTIKSIPLITSSILSKKIVENLDGLLLDIKIGRGTFFETIQETSELIRYLHEIARRFDIKLRCMYTAMDQPLGYSIGNWHEIREVIASLRDALKGELTEITLRLGAELLCLAGMTTQLDEALEMLRSKVESGDAYHKFLEIIEAQGGDTDNIQEIKPYTSSRHHIILKSKFSGYVQEIDALNLGLLSMEIGAGRHHINDIIDPRAGLILHAKIADQVKEGDPLIEIYTDQDISGSVLDEKVSNYVRITEDKRERPPIILGVVDAS